MGNSTEFFVVNNSTQVINEGGKIETCFTGFTKEDKERLTTIAKEKNMLVRETVTVKLDFLCGGYNAGSAKKEKAKNQGAIFLTEEQFLLMIETGELPEKQ